MTKKVGTGIDSGLENQRSATRPDIVNLIDDIISIKAPIFIHKSRYEILKEICNLTGEDLTEYLRQALYEKIQCDLTNPSIIGQLFCERILPIWDTNKGHNDYRCLQSDCGFSS